VASGGLEPEVARSGKPAGLPGRVVRRISNVYWVAADAGPEFACQLRARLRKEQVEVRIGDRVGLAEVDAINATAAIAEVLPRTRTLARPPIANVDQILVVFAAAQPDFSPPLLDRFLVLAGCSDIPAAIVINKADLVPAATLAAIVEPYRAIGYQVAATSARNGDVAELAALLPGKVSVFAGPSGVGKSSLLNRFDPALALKAADVSAKLGRGRHTTTSASLYPVGGGFVADTPGYSHLAFPALDPEGLAWLYPELAPHASDCRLSDCLHDSEPDCAVKARAAVNPERYQSYLKFLHELVEQRRTSRARSQKVEAAVKTTGGPGGGKRLVRIDAEQRVDSRRTVKQRLAELATQRAEGTLDEERLAGFED